MPVTQGVFLKNKSHQSPDFKAVVDETNGAITIMTTGYNFSKSITLTMDELPDRFQTFFTTYLLCKEK